MQEQRWPLSGADYPRTFQELEQWFATEAQCREYLARLRWPTGFRCSQCDSQDEPWVTGRDRLRCKGCRCDISLTGGTL
ncbi:MAG: transposase, partial [Gammaproteobacteria bacterium]